MISILKNAASRGYYGVYITPVQELEPVTHDRGDYLLRVCTPYSEMLHLQNDLQYLRENGVSTSTVSRAIICRFYDGVTGTDPNLNQLSGLHKESKEKIVKDYEEICGNPPHIASSDFYDQFEDWFDWMCCVEDHGFIVKELPRSWIEYLTFQPERYAITPE